MEKIYKSKVDPWLGIILLAVILISCLAFLDAVTKEDTASQVSAFTTLILGAGLPMWLFLNTRYVLSETQLSIFSGPFTWRIPIKDISEIEPSSSVLSSPALSVDRLRIVYGKGRSIMISPKLKAEFIEELERRRAKFQ